MNVSQAAHGLAVGDVVRFDGSDYVKAQADSAPDAEVAGVVSAVPNANNFTLTTSGYISGLSGLTPGSTYFLSEATPGLLTATEPSTIGNVSKPVLNALSATTALIIHSRGIVLETGTAGGGTTLTTFTSDGSFTATRSSAIMCGSGGGGGGSGGTNNGHGGTGGNSGAFSCPTVPLVIGRLYNVFIGDGGIGGNNGSTTASNGSIGGDTYVVDSVTSEVIARWKGGRGGVGHDGTTASHPGDLFPGNQARGGAGCDSSGLNCGAPEPAAFSVADQLAAVSPGANGDGGPGASGEGPGGAKSPVTTGVVGNDATGYGGGGGGAGGGSLSGKGGDGYQGRLRVYQ